jgi:hypothetical protein
VRAEPRRWRTPFGRWVRRVGPQRVATELSRLGQPVTHWAVFKWVSGQHMPRRDHVTALLRLSRGRLTAGDIYGHVTAVRSTRISAIQRENTPLINSN